MFSTFMNIILNTIEVQLKTQFETQFQIQLKMQFQTLFQIQSQIQYTQLNVKSNMKIWIQDWLNNSDIMELIIASKPWRSQSEKDNCIVAFNIRISIEWEINEIIGKLNIELKLGH